MTHTPPLEVGRRLRDLRLVSSSGDDVTLSSLRGEATLLIFLRHLG